MLDHLAWVYLISWEFTGTQAAEDGGYRIWGQPELQWEEIVER